MSSDSWDSRTRLLLGDENADRLRAATVMVAGLGGVGGYVAEVLARSGVGNLILIDADDVALSNLNRQIIATHNTVGRPKSEVWRERLLSINPDLHVDARREFITPDNVGLMLQPRPDFVADAIDTVAPKVELMRRCVEQEIPLISSMGAGGRLDPSQVCYGTLATTQGDGLARTLRTRLRKMNVAINNIEVVWSRELPERRAVIELMEQNKRSSFGTMATIPALFGIYMANKIIREITGI